VSTRSCRSFRVGTRLALACLLSAAATAAVAAKELHWSALEVDATLENDGTLKISELQKMVFTGDWNGGERIFRTFLGQSIEVDRIVRTDASGVSRELERGDLDDVDRWNWKGSQTLRWRSRAPSDPEFSQTPIDYRLDYRVKGVLEKKGERYVLNHDFAFADRQGGVIERVVVRLALGSNWRATSPMPVSWEHGPLPSGEGFVVTQEFEYLGDQPLTGGVKQKLPGWAPPAAAGAFLAAVAYFFVRWRVRDGALGRFVPRAQSEVDAAWLEENVFSHRAEVIGAAWDRKVSSSEVAGLLARLTTEGKLRSEIKSTGSFIFKRDDLHLKVLVDRSAFTGYEAELIDGLFGASDETDTASLRKRYRSSGFDPAAKIRKGVEEGVERLGGFSTKSRKPNWKPTGLLLLGAVLVFAAAFVLVPANRGIIFFMLLAFTLPWIFFGLIGGLRGQDRVESPVGPLVQVLLGVALHAAGLAFFATLPGTAPLHMVGALLWATALARCSFNLLATRESAESLTRRRWLAQARDYFVRELRAERPRLDDRWFPYLVAFGLGGDMDRWFKRFGSAAAVGRTSTSTYGGGSGGSGGGSWSGGGGAFGGGGSSATWAAAATAMGAGVASASSSSSGGGGGSSGGGGGGGW
jgi:uncharacterized membrane protein YgcG